MPPAAQAACTSPEQSNPSEHGPVPQLLPGLVLYRFNASLYYANASRFAEDVHAIMAPAEPPLVTLCIDAAGINDIDYTGMETLREVITQAHGQGVMVVFAEVSDNVREQLKRAGIIDLVGADAAAFSFSAQDL